MRNTRAEISELFSSIQGEGIFLGARQIFIRFKRCNLNCVFCDEPRNLRPVSYTSAELLAEVKSLDARKGPHHSVSLTGGEPLLYHDFLKIFLPLLKRAGFKSYLETNGTLPDELSKVIDLVDIIAMDFKLPSSTGERAFWKEHLKFLRVSSKKNVFVKAVVTPATKNEDIEKAIAIIKKVNKEISLILQPATPVKPDEADIDKYRLLELLEIGTRKNLLNVRVIPQIHKMLGVK